MTRPIGVERLQTGITGIDAIAGGGLPRGRAALVVGTSGSAKTVLAAQFLAEGIMQQNDPGVFVTFEETPADLRLNMAGFNWDIADWERQRKWVFVDASPRGKDRSTVTGDYDFGALIARLEHAVRTVSAKRLAIDSIGAIFAQFSRPDVIRSEMLRLTEALKTLGVTALITVERETEDGLISRHGVEEFVTDTVVVLRNHMEQEKRRRTVEILKMRGADHNKGEFPFTILGDVGIIASPLSAIELRQKSSDLRLSSGIPDLDKMCNGGFFRDSVVLLSGATGTGKTLMVTQFLATGADPNERRLLFAFEESREQLFRNARGWGFPFEELEKQGVLKVHCIYPEVKGLEDHLIDIRNLITEFKPTRVAIDSLSALERVGSLKSFREFVIGLTSMIKTEEVCGLFTSTTPALMGGTSITEAHISTITDTIILLRYIELFGEMRRGLTVLKMRGSRHDKDIREMSIDEKGMHIGQPFRNVSGILSGVPNYLDNSEIERLSSLFSDGQS